MADSPPPPPPAPTTITGLGDDSLLKIFLLLPDVTSLARAAFACRTFLHAVRSSPAFRRRFRQLRAPPLIALFQENMCAIVPAAVGKSSDIAAAFSGLLLDSDASESEWESDVSEPDFPGYSEGYADFVSRATDQLATYSPHSQALRIYPRRPRYGEERQPSSCLLEFHTLSPDGEERRPSRVVCVHRARDWAWARVAIFSSRTMEWSVVLPQMDTRGLLAAPCLSGQSSYRTTKVINGFVCWVLYTEEEAGCILALNTATFQFSRMDLPPPLKVPLYPSMFQLGGTKDGEFCVVSVDEPQCMLSVWLWAADGDGVERFMLHKTISLCANVQEITECSEVADVGIQLMAVIDSFVYLSLIIPRDVHTPEWFLSFCLETAEVNLLHKESQFHWCSVDPYIMVGWPSSLIHGKEDSEARVAGHISEADCPLGTEEAFPVLYTALLSFKEQLIDDGNSNFAKINSFLLDDETNSLINRIATLESGLAAATDRVLRIHAEPKA